MQLVLDSIRSGMQFQKFIADAALKVRCGCCFRFLFNLTIFLELLKDWLGLS